MTTKTEYEVMKKVIYIILFGLLIVSCTTNKYLPKKYKIGEVEYFDIEEFERIKDKKYGSYYLNKEDTVEILKTKNKEWYGDYVTLYKKNYSIIKRFYPNGIIMERGKTYYPSGFEIGIWEYFDEAGNLIKTEDMDKKYKLSYKKAMRKVLRYYCFSKKDLMIEIMPGNDRLFWVFSKNGKSKAVDMNTGKVYDASVRESGRVSRGKDGLDYIEEACKKNLETPQDSTNTNRK